MLPLPIARTIIPLIIGGIMILLLNHPAAIDKNFEKKIDHLKKNIISIEIIDQTDEEYSVNIDFNKDCRARIIVNKKSGEVDFLRIYDKKSITGRNFIEEYGYARVRHSIFNPKTDKDKANLLKYLQENAKPKKKKLWFW